MARHALAALMARTWLKTLRRPVVLSFSFVQPLIWMLFFGFLFQRYPLEGSRPGLSYLSFLAPGVAAMSVLFGASQSGIALIRDMQTGFLARMLATPADHRLLLGAKLLADVIRLVLQAALVLGLGVLVGARLEPSVAGVLPALAALGAFALTLAALSCLIALRTRSQESMAVFVHLVNMPLLFSSSALVPGRQMPPWLRELSAFNPLTLAVGALRRSLVLGEVPSWTRSVLPLAVLAAVLFWLAARAMKAALQD